MLERVHIQVVLKLFCLMGTLPTYLECLMYCTRGAIQNFSTSSHPLHILVTGTYMYVHVCTCMWLQASKYYMYIRMLPLELINYLAWVHAIPWAHNIPEEAIPVAPTQLTHLHVHISESCQLKAGRAIHVPSPDNHARIRCSSSLKLLPWTSMLHVWLPRLPAVHVHVYVAQAC